MDRYLLNLERQMIVATANDLDTPLTKYGHCGHLYSYEGLTEWFPTPVMAANALINKLRHALDDIA